VSQEDDVFEAIARLVADGEYRDWRTRVLGPKPEPRVDCPTAGPTGWPRPPLLRRLYLEVGNGGFGPRDGILGVRRGLGTGIRLFLGAGGKRRTFKAL